MQENRLLAVFWGGIVAGLLTLGATDALAAPIVIQLEGQHAGGAGQHGLYLGPSNWGYQSSTMTNWEWTDVSMTILENGNATITGSMKRLYDRQIHYSGYWGLEIQLSNVVKKGSGASIAQILDAGVLHTGLEWKTLSMKLTKPSDLPYSTSVPLTGWVGYAMPNQGHPNVAELHFDPRGLTFEAWYKNPRTSSWYKVGDTKSDGHRPPIPEPGAAVLFCAGLLVVARKLRAA
jgi:hypothetical protein